jgi:uncharacterized protein YkwD
MRTRSGVVIVLVMLATLLFATVPAGAPAATSLNSYEQQLVKLINKERAKKGLRALRVNSKLVTSARSHSTEMADEKYFEHDSLSGESWSARIIRCGYSRTGYRVWKTGENIWYGSGLSSSPVVVVDGWMNSKAHRQVILTKSFRDIGVGAVETNDGFRACPSSVWFFTLDLGCRSK